MAIRVFEMRQALAPPFALCRSLMKPNSIFDIEQCQDRTPQALGDIFR
jgi:hypothetical protein